MLREDDEVVVASVVVSERVKGEGNMFKANMIAPCGLDCNESTDDQKRRDGRFFGV